MNELYTFAKKYVSNHLHQVVVGADAQIIKMAGSIPVIATHNGSFHCDEALACSLLRHLPIYASANILRSRDSALIDQAKIVVDVGAVYDHDKLRYDHHQSSFHGTMTTEKKTYNTRLSSAGLVYKHYGKDIIRQYIRDVLGSEKREEVLQMTQWDSKRTEATEDEVIILFDAVYRSFVEAVDAIDNGVDAFRMEAATEAGEKAILQRDVVMKKGYTVGTSLASRVGDLQLWWNDPRRGGPLEGKLENIRFVQAMELSAVEFFQSLSFYAFSWLPARALVQKAFEQATTVHPSGRIMVFPTSGCPWKEHLFALEEENNAVGRTLYVLFSDGRSWRIQAVPVEPTGFENRKALPFKGLRDAELSAASGIPGGVFVHVSGFIGGMATYEGALALATKAVEMPVE